MYQVKRGKLMEKDFINEMDFSKAIKLEKPIAILLTGDPGSGKTMLARMISRKLKLYVISSDYIRNYYYQFTKDYSDEKRQEIAHKVLNINIERFKKIISSNISFISDRNSNTNEDVNEFISGYGIGENYTIIKIKINSNDEVNIERISRRKADFKQIDDEIIGENISYSVPYPKEVYYEIKERKPIIVEDEEFDYIIDNNGTLEEFKQQIENVIHKIEKQIKQIEFE